MDVKGCCENVTVELPGSKATMCELARKLDRMPTGAYNIVDDVNDLHRIIEELGDRINRFRKERPVSWKPERDRLAQKTGLFGRKLEDVIDAFSQNDAGD